MSKKNEVATAQKSETTKKVVYKMPNGKFISAEERKNKRKERESQYIDFRVKALKRRAKRMGLSEEETEKAVGLLMIEIDTAKTYDILIMFNRKNYDMIKQALLEKDIKYKILSNTYGYIEGDAELLNKIRELMPPGTKIHPYAKKNSPILPVRVQHAKTKKPKTKKEKKDAAFAAKKARKAANIQAHANRGEHAKQRKEFKNKKMRHIEKQKKLFDKRCQKALKKGKATTVHMKAKKGSNASKKASTLKKVA